MDGEEVTEMGEELMRYLAAFFVRYVLLLFPILADGFVCRHVLLTHPFIVAVRVPLPLDQVLPGLPSPIVACVQNLLDFVFLLIGDEVRGRTS